MMKRTKMELEQKRGRVVMYRNGDGDGNNYGNGWGWRQF